MVKRKKQTCSKCENTMNHLALPEHVAIIMDGNGRWAKERKRPRFFGHRHGVKAVRKAIEFCVASKIPTLTLFALSVENFLFRPEKEVSLLLRLLSESIASYLPKLVHQGVKLSFIGDLSAFPDQFLSDIEKSKKLTQDGHVLNLVVALNYSGRWDVFQAANKYRDYCNQQGGEAFGEQDHYSRFLSLASFSDPDLLIRTGGDQRISNFLLWQCAYTEIFFMNEFWPDFDDVSFQKAIDFYAASQRRFGRVKEESYSE